MSYVAMARKWRPQTFADLIGQEHVAKIIANAIEGDRLHHAFLFTGTRGVGKTTSARIFAKTLNCTQRNGVHPCGNCASCLEITSGSSLDVIEIDGASNNSVDNIRELIEQVKYAPMNGGYRIIVIDEVHMLTGSAFNALLKTLEEPPPHVVFVFATTESKKVPQTILSRIQRFDFKPISVAKITQRLQFICQAENLQYEDGCLELIAEKGDGSMRDALTLFDQVYSFSGSDLQLKDVQSILGVPPEELFFQLMEAIIAKNQVSSFRALHAFFNTGLEIADFLEGLFKYLRNLAFVKVSGFTAEDLAISSDAFQRIQTLCQSLEQGDVLRYAKILSDVQQNVKNAPHPRIALEMGIARMAYIDSVHTIRQLVNKLENEDSSKKKL